MWFPEVLSATTPHVDQQLFYTGSAGWQVWKKPEGRCFAWMLCIGGAAGGGSPANSSANGGGGGGSGAMARLFISLGMLPDALYIQVGAGGAGGAANGGTGVSGGRSFISLQPNSTAANCYLASGHTAATGGLTNSNAGAAETIATVADCILASFGNFTFIAGATPGAAGANVTALGAIPLTGGAGGGFTGSAGGNITGAGLIPTITGGAGNSGASGSGGAGISGITLWPIGRTGFMSCGGSGGGGCNGASATGGVGGNGGLGSGGGGGGVNASGTAGLGGKGGDGLVAIWSV